MHDRTRRLLCRLGFMLLCVLPTVVVVVCIGITRSSPYRAAQRTAFERSLSEQLGLVVSLQAVSRPARHITLLEQVQFSDPETDQPIAQIRQIEIQQRGSELAIAASQPEIQGDQIWRLWEVLHDRLLRGYVARGLQARFYAGEVTVHRMYGERGTTLTDVKCQFAAADDGPEVAIQFSDVALPSSQPAVLRVTRNCQISPPATRWQFQTPSTPMPCSLLADRLEILEALGEEATFQGTVEATCTADGWQGELLGSFRQTDLDRLVTERFPHKLSGIADIVFNRAVFRDGRIIEASGEVRCDGGVVSRSLLVAASRHLGLVVDTRVDSVALNTTSAYEQLRLGFEMNADRLQLVGLCQTGVEGVVIADADGPLLTDRPSEVRQAVALVRALVSDLGEQVPVSHEARQLLYVLPAPSRHRVPTLATPRIPTPRLQLQSNHPADAHERSSVQPR